jgi:hypothetical protein
MQEAVDYLEKNKVFIEALGIEMVPLSIAYTSLEMSINNQISQVLESFQQEMGGLIGDIENITTEENE